MNKLKTLLFTLFLFFSLLLTGCGDIIQPDGVTATEVPIVLSDYKGKWIVVNYWAPWCEPCLKELPELNKLYNTHKDDVMVLGVSFDIMTDKDIRTFTESLGIDFPMLSSFDREKFGIKSVATLPITYLFSPEGKLAKTLNGPQTEKSLLDAMELK